MLRTNFIHTTLYTTLYAALSLGLVACTGVDNDTVGDSESEGETSESAGSTSAGSTSAGSTSAGESASSTGGDSGSDTANGGDTSTSGAASGATSGEDPTTTDAPTSTSGSTDSTGGEVDSVSESCEAACEVVLVCLEDQYESEEECVADCIEETMPDEPSAECDAAIIDFNSCIAATSCEVFDSDSFCEAELDLMTELCVIGGEECLVGIGGDAGSCGIVQECDDGSMELLCEGDFCLCLLDAEEVGSCTNDVCVDELDPNALYDKALTCCGFEF